MYIFTDTTPQYWALTILGAATLFTIFWFKDALTHKAVVDTDITNRELQTHRILITSSILMELSLVAMYWFPIAALPFFIAFFLTRTAHEFIDELHFHTTRCSSNEMMLHFGMWISVLIKTSAMFIWGFFAKYDGILDLHFAYYLWAFVILGTMSYTTLIEWKQQKSEETTN